MTDINPDADPATAKALIVIASDGSFQGWVGKGRVVMEDAECRAWLLDELAPGAADALDAVAQYDCDGEMESEQVLALARPYLTWRYATSGHRP